MILVNAYMKGKSTCCNNTITPAEWFEYFKRLYNPEVHESVKKCQIQDRLSQHEDPCDLCAGDDLHELNK